jgi:NAD-dependent deacetylase
MTIDATLIQKLKTAQHLVVLTGAGVSAESGIPTFRDALTGFWENRDPEKLGSKKGYEREPDVAWGWYEWRRQKVLQSQPNPAHETIAKLATQLPKVTLITQNVDDLHERAGSEEVLHLHGSIHKARCIHCYAPYEHPEIELPDVLLEKRIEPPECEKCGDLIRPGVVWFGENLPTPILEKATQAAEECDLMLIIGTSGLVYPAANLPMIAIRRKITTIQINPTNTEFDMNVTFNVKEKAGEFLPELYKTTFGE